MKNNIDSFTEIISIRRRRNKHITRAVITLLGIAVVALIFVLFSRTAFTMDAETDYICGFDGHTHTADCVEDILVCGFDDASSFGTPTELDDTHTHTYECYIHEFICGKSEHTHTADCYTVKSETLAEEEFAFECSLCGVKKLHGHGDGSETAVSKSGGIMAMAAAAFTGNPWELENFTTGVTLKDANGIVIAPGGNVTVGNNYILSLSFKETSNLQFAYNAGVLTYHLPSNVSVPSAVTDAPIYGQNNAVIGSYSITTGGAITVKFKEVNASGIPTVPMNFINVYTNANFKIDILAKFTGTGGEVSFDFGNNIKLDIKVNQLEPYPTITKSASSYDPNTNKITYTVTVTAKDGDLTIDTFSDWARKTGSGGNQNLGIGPDYFTLTSVTVNEAAYSNYTTAWAASPNNDPPIFAINFTGGVTIPKDKTMVVTYTIDLTNFITNEYGISTNYDFNIHNEASASYKDSNDIIKTVKATKDVTVKKSFISKSGKFTADSGEGVTTGKITWTITIGDGKTPLNGATVIDTLGAGFTVADRPSTINIVLKDQTNSATVLTDAAYPVTAGTGKDFSFTIPASSPAAYYATITYTINIDTSVGYPTNGIYTNEVIINITGNPWTTGSITVRKPEKPGVMDNNDAQKSVIYKDENTLEYTITVSVPKEMAGQNIRIIDRLYINEPASDKYAYVTNSPENLKIYFNGELIESGAAPYGWSILNNGSIAGSKRILFGNTTVDANSVWGSNNPESENFIDWDTEMVIKYEIPLSAPLILADGTKDFWTDWNIPHDEVVTLGDMLERSPGYYVTNQATFWNATTRLFSANKEAKISWPVFKNRQNGTPTDPLDPVGTDLSGNTVFNYEVVLNPIPQNSTRWQIFTSGGDAIFFDDFDPRLEYVEGSFSAEVHGAPNYNWNGQKLYGWLHSTYKYPTAGTVTGPTTNSPEHSLIVNLKDLVQTQLSPSVGNLGSCWYASTDSQAYTILIKYQLKFKEGVEENLFEPIELKNTAGFIGTSNTHQGAFTNESTVTYGKKPIGKEMSLDGQIATFDIIVNPYGIKIDGGANLLVTDKMNNTLAFYLTSITAETESTIKSGVFDTPVTLHQTAELDHNDEWSWAITGENEITFVIPDKIPVKIIYKALIKETGNNVKIENYVEVSGKYYDVYDKNWNVTDTNASGGGDYSGFLVMKSDEENPGKLLPGAEFALYIGWPVGTHSGFASQNTDVQTIERAVPTFTQGGYNFYYIYAYYDTENNPGRCDEYGTTDDGYYHFINNWITDDSIDEGAVFAVREIKVPDGYETPSDTVTIVDFSSGEITDYITVSNTPKKIGVTIYGKKEIQGTPAGVIPNFRFNLTQVTNEKGDVVKPNGKNDSITKNAATEFEFDLGLLGPGTYYYLLAETPLSTTAYPDWTCDDTEYIVKVTVSSNGAGVPVATVQYKFKTIDSEEWTWTTGSELNPVTFRNKYGDESVEITIKGKKLIEGTDAPDAKFYFKLTQLNSVNPNDITTGGIVRTAETETNGAGTYSFSFSPVSLAGTGTYYFKVEEYIPNGISYDSKWALDLVSKIVTVTVSDTGEGLEISAVTPDVDVNPPLFTNKYDEELAPLAVRIEVPVVKTIDGTGYDADKKFKIYIEEGIWDGNDFDLIDPSEYIDNEYIEIKGGETDAFIIGDFLPGTYYFRIWEDQTGDGTNGWEYDKNDYIIKIVVANDGKVTITDAKTGTPLSVDGLRSTSVWSTKRTDSEKYSFDPLTTYTLDHFVPFKAFPDINYNDNIFMIKNKTWEIPSLCADWRIHPPAEGDLMKFHESKDNSAAALAFALFSNEYGAKLTDTDFWSLFGVDSGNLSNNPRKGIMQFSLWYFEERNQEPLEDWGLTPPIQWPKYRFYELGGPININIYDDFIKNGGSPYANEYLQMLGIIDEMMGYYSDIYSGKSITSLKLNFDYTSSSTGAITLGYDGYQPPDHDLVLSWTGNVTVQVNANTPTNISGVTVRVGDSITVTSISGDAAFTLSDPLYYLVNGSIKGSMLLANDGNPKWDTQRAITGTAEFIKMSTTLTVGESEIKFENKYTFTGGPKLPETGGIGIEILIGIGGLLVTATTGAFIYRRKLESIRAKKIKMQ